MSSSGPRLPGRPPKPQKSTSSRSSASADASFHTPAHSSGRSATPSPSSPPSSGTSSSAASRPPLGPSRPIKPRSSASTDRGLHTPEGRSATTSTVPPSTSSSSITSRSDWGTNEALPNLVTATTIPSTSNTPSQRRQPTPSSTRPPSQRRQPNRTAPRPPNLSEHASSTLAQSIRHQLNHAKCKLVIYQTERDTGNYSGGDSSDLDQKIAVQQQCVDALLHEFDRLMPPMPPMTAPTPRATTAAPSPTRPASTTPLPAMPWTSTSTPPPPPPRGRPGGTGSVPYDRQIRELLQKHKEHGRRIAIFRKEIATLRLYREDVGEGPVGGEGEDGGVRTFGRPFGDDQRGREKAERMERERHVDEGIRAFERAIEVEQREMGRKAGRSPGGR